MNILFALPFIILVQLAAMELDCNMMGLKSPSQCLFDWLDRKLER